MTAPHCYYSGGVTDGQSLRWLVISLSLSGPFEILFAFFG